MEHSSEESSSENDGIGDNMDYLSSYESVCVDGGATPMEEDACSICSEGTYPNVRTFPKCDHKFHTKCLRGTRKCPVCSKTYTGSRAGKDFCAKCGKLLIPAIVTCSGRHLFHQLCIDQYPDRKCPICHTTTTSSLLDDSDDDETSVCFYCSQELGTIDVYETPCGHKLHSKCFLKHLEFGYQTCRICDSDLMTLEW